MGAGILPTTIHNGKLYFLFGKENKYEKSAPGFSDFGGGKDNSESFFETAIREACEELTGFLGDENDVRKLLKSHGTYEIDHKSSGFTQYKMFIFPFEYDELLPHYYNNNQRFLQKRLDADVIKKSRIFEKAEIKWICVDELKAMRPKFRSYFQNIIDIILSKKGSIESFIQKSLPKKVAKTVRKRKASSKTRRNWLW
jgi:8-oxo-dGTP pyrophosphatase MutT (NUDIX family)